MINIVITGKHLNVGDSLREHIEEKLNIAVEKYVDRINKINVVISKQAQLFNVDIHGNLGTHAGITINAKRDNEDPYVAFDEACEKIAKQLRRYKRQITNHHVAPVDVAVQKFQSKYYVVSAESESEEASDNPLIIAEDANHIEHLTVSDAVMRLDLGELQTLVFINQANDRLNVIYRRTDGNIGWVDPEVNEVRSLAA